MKPGLLPLKICIVMRGNYDDGFLECKIRERDQILQYNSNVNQILDETISLTEVEYAVNHAKNNKAVGIDNVANEVLKNRQMIGLLHKLYANLYDRGQIPTMWKKAIIHPIPKGKGNKVEPLLYRGLALQSCVYKIYSSILNMRLTKYLEGEELISEVQNGFRKSRSCMQHVYILQEVLRYRLGEKKPTFLCFVDFCKAFDYLNRNLLRSRLIEMGVKGKMYMALQESYDVTLNAVRLNSEVGRWFNTYDRVKQGDNLSPSLFSCYVNGLLRELVTSNISVHFIDLTISVLAYADDLVLIAPTQAGLQRLIELVEHWCKKWRLQVNVNKTKIMHIRPKNCDKSTYDFRYNDECLESVDKYRYLGVIFDVNGNIQECANTLAKSGKRALGSLINKIKRNGDISYKTFIKLYSGCVVPILDYCGGIWGVKKCKQRKLNHLDKVQQRVQHFYLGIDKRSPIAGFEADMPLSDGLDRRIVEGVRFYNSLLKLDTTRLVKQVYETSQVNLKESWVGDIRDWLIELGFEAEWEHQSEVNLDRLAKQLAIRRDERWVRNEEQKPNL